MNETVKPRLYEGQFPHDLPREYADKFRLIHCDPPYGGIVPEQWDTMTGDGYLQLARQLATYLEPGGSIMIWGGTGKIGNRPFLDFLARVERETDLEIRDLITWKKRRAYGCPDRYLYCREELVWLTLGDSPKWTFNVPLLNEKRGYAGYNPKYPAKSEYKRRSNVWTDIPELFRWKIHPTEKPLDLMQVIIETHSNPGDLVLDAMAGSGSFSAAALGTDRVPVAIEQDPGYCDCIRERIPAMAGRQATIGPDLVWRDDDDEK